MGREGSVAIVVVVLSLATSASVLAGEDATYREYSSELMRLASAAGTPMDSSLVREIDLAARRAADFHASAPATVALEDEALFGEIWHVCFGHRSMPCSVVGDFGPNNYYGCLSINPGSGTGIWGPDQVLATFPSGTHYAWTMGSLGYPVTGTHAPGLFAGSGCKLSNYYVFVFFAGTGVFREACIAPFCPG